MKTAVITLLAAANTAAALTQQCSGRAVNEGGNYFCGAVNHILYQGIGSSGDYQSVTGMTSTGECMRETKSFSGPLAPLNEGLSLHFRGPISVKEVAVYTLSAASKKKRDELALPAAAAAAADDDDDESTRQGGAARQRSVHGHGHRHLHGSKKNKRVDMVTAVIDGQVQSWVNNWFGPPSAPTAAAAPASQPPAPPAPAADAPAAPAANANANADPGSSSSSSSQPPASGKDWDRTSYYNADSQTAENIVFLGNYGGAGSGVFDYVWGNSLSFLNSQGTGGASSPQVLANDQVPSNKEFAIFSGEKCDASCGFSRAPDVAYKGFEGAHKVFLFNFKMPMDGSRGFNGDMPAIWALNAAIPRAAQYNACTCWPACGEFDFFEVLAPGDAKCKSTVHLTNGGGSSDYFPRPTDAYMKAAVVFDADTGVSIRILPSNTDFSNGLDDATVQSWVSGNSTSSVEEGGAVKELVSSLFQIGSNLVS